MLRNPLFGDGPDAQLRVARGTQLADDEHVERGTQRPGHLGGHDHAAPRKAEHHRVGETKQSHLLAEEHAVVAQLDRDVGGHRQAEVADRGRDGQAISRQGSGRGAVEVVRLQGQVGPGKGKGLEGEGGGKGIALPRAVLLLAGAEILKRAETGLDATFGRGTKGIHVVDAMVKNLKVRGVI